RAGSLPPLAGISLRRSPSWRRPTATKAGSTSSTATLILTYHDIAAAISAVLGREVVYRPVSSDEHRSILSDAGLPEPVVEAIVGIDAGLRQGAMPRVGDDLTRLLGRPTTSFGDGIRAAIEGQTTNAQ